MRAVSDKLLAGVFTALVAAPAVVVCYGGTAIVASAFGGLTSWLSGFSANTALLIALLTAVFFMSIRQFRSWKKEPVAKLKKDEL